eukprot:3467552-Rhodomonas_salina.2
MPVTRLGARATSEQEHATRRTNLRNQRLRLAKATTFALLHTSNCGCNRLIPGFESHPMIMIMIMMARALVRQQPQPGLGESTRIATTPRNPIQNTAFLVQIVL